MFLWSSNDTRKQRIVVDQFFNHAYSLNPKFVLPMELINIIIAFAKQTTIRLTNQWKTKHTIINDTGNILERLNPDDERQSNIH